MGLVSYSVLRCWDTATPTELLLPAWRPRLLQTETRAAQSEGEGVGLDRGPVVALHEEKLTGRGVMATSLYKLVLFFLKPVVLPGKLRCGGGEEESET